MQVFVYRLIDPSVLLAQEAALRAHLFAALPGRVVEPVFELSPVSGAFKYFDLGRLWRGAKPERLPKNETEAARAVMQFFMAVNRSAAQYRQRLDLDSAQYPDPFPLSSLRHTASRPVFEAAAKQPDHWLSHWLMFLPCAVPPIDDLGPGSLAPVYGSAVEARIGADGQVIGVVSSARTVVGRKRVDAFPAHGASHDGDGAGTLLYLLTEPQTFLSPYYMLDDEAEDPHGLSLRPACAYSLIVDIAVEQSNSGMRVVAVAMDSNGKLAPVARGQEYRLLWSYARLEDLGTGESVETDAQELRLTTPGIYHVAVTVEHRPTESQRMAFRVIVVAMPVEDTQTGLSS